MIQGKRIVITRPAHQSREFIRQLEDMGAQCLAIPLIEIESTSDLDGLDRIVTHLDEFDWIIFTSTNAVQPVLESMDRVGIHPSTLKHCQAAVVGKKTKKRAQSLGFTVDICPEKQSGEGLFELFSANYLERSPSVQRANHASDNTGATRHPGNSLPLAGARLFYPKASKAPGFLREQVSSAGGELIEFVAYHTNLLRENAEEIRRQIEASAIDVITFFSPSAIESLAESPIGDIRRVKIAVIGPTTEQAAREFGLNPEIVATEPSAESLARAIVSYYSK